MALEPESGARDLRDPRDRRDPRDLPAGANAAEHSGAAASASPADHGAAVSGTGAGAADTPPPTHRAPVDRPLRIGICGGANAPPEDCAAAEEAGRRIGQAGALLVCGGRTGVMEAAARGAVLAGGLTIGILPGEHAEEANPYIAIPLPTGMAEARNVLVVRAADAVIAIGGEWGTLSEVALAGKVGVPVVLLRPRLARGLGLECALTAEDAVRRALGHARRRRA